MLANIAFDDEKHSKNIRLKTNIYVLRKPAGKTRVGTIVTRMDKIEAYIKNLRKPNLAEIKASIPIFPRSTNQKRIAQFQFP